MAKRSVEEEVADLRTRLVKGETVKGIQKDTSVDFSDDAWEVVLGDQAAERPPRGGGSMQPSAARVGLASPLR